MKEKFSRRKQLRLKEYDYSQEGYYFITICTQNRLQILSKIICNCRGEVPPSPAKTKIGKQVEETIKYIEQKYDSIRIDDFVIMPNHIHLIIQNTGEGGTSPLHKIIIELKTYTTKKYNEFNKTRGLKLWQRNYYEHVIRNEKEYYLIKQYIQDNPLNWEKDKYY